jgi:hypothetical protein
MTLLRSWASAVCVNAMDMSLLRSWLSGGSTEGYKHDAPTELGGRGLREGPIDMSLLRRWASEVCVSAIGMSLLRSLLSAVCVGAIGMSLL